MTGRQDPQTWAIIGAGIEVHRALGNGFLEAVYQSAMETEFHRRRIPFTRQTRLPVRYKGEILPVAYRVDFVCFGEIIVELKAVENIGMRERAQVIHYLRASALCRALLLNFRGPRLGIQRVIYSPWFRRPP